MKIDKNLVVEIPKKYRKQLISRFSPSNLHNGIIQVECPLCRDFGCYECPLSKPSMRCMSWIRSINYSMRNIFTFYRPYIIITYETTKTTKSSLAKKVLKEFKERALKHIVWI